MLSRAQIKYIQSLQLNKFRTQHSVYVAEGEKMAAELLQAGEGVMRVYAVQSWADANMRLLNASKAEYHIVSEDELKKISSLSTPNKVLVLATIPERSLPVKLADGLYIALENMQDPGNLGTIIRTADWFGFNGVICSDNSVDAYNSKVVQATMGSIVRLPVYYTDLEKVIKDNTQLPTYAAVLGGEDIYAAKLPSSAMVLIGNESKGLSAGMQALAKHKITIPKYGNAESLNASMAAGVIMAAFRR